MLVREGATANKQHVSPSAPRLVSFLPPPSQPLSAPSRSFKDTHSLKLTQISHPNYPLNLFTRHLLLFAAMLAVTSAVVLAVAASVLAEPVPLTPDTGIVGQPCAIQWQPDTTGIWKQVRKSSVQAEIRPGR